MNRGFTLIELILTISISVLISLVLFLNYAKLGSDISLKRTAQEMALVVREAQVYGLGVKEQRSGAGETAFPGYGIHFSALNPDSFILFADYKPANNRYDAGDELVKEFKIKGPEKIVDLCIDQKVSPAPPSAQCNLIVLDIVYLRPYLAVNIRGNDGGVTGTSDSQVVIESPRGNQKKVITWITGQISVE